MDSESSTSAYSPPTLRHKLRTTVCGCFGSPGNDGGRAKWRRRVAATGEFRYDPLSYALNFDDGGSDDSDEGADAAAAAFRYRDFSSRLPPSPKPAAARRLTAVAIA
ncbi:uncharacterized protein LOC124699172 [Lolium rigidum]|uniref:uncharacterized protein LOC124699172 n=1 Tax=Lolium rigidum TaxID=89674 RepID=UPI001F5D15C1|nr:uncharacterized protein LOC124699172 [Lolium rigidum]XP_051207684.1 uncharacterized protein LOC127323607 [Lolium perenne]